MECCGTCGNNCYDGGEFVCSCEATQRDLIQRELIIERREIFNGGDR